MADNLTEASKEEVRAVPQQLQDVRKSEQIEEVYKIVVDLLEDDMKLKMKAYACVFSGKGQETKEQYHQDVQVVAQIAEELEIAMIFVMQNGLKHRCNLATIFYQLKAGTGYGCYSRVSGSLDLGPGGEWGRPGAVPGGCGEKRMPGPRANIMSDDFFRNMYVGGGGRGPEPALRPPGAEFRRSPPARTLRTAQGPRA